MFRHAEELLRGVGIKKAKQFWIAAAQLVGEKGLVYAVDTNSKKLKDLKRTFKSRKLKI